MADVRKGLNCFLSYQGAGARKSYSVRVNLANHGVVMVAAESSGRDRRAYYPHRAAPAQFTISPLLIGYAERKSFSDWMQTYADYVLDPGAAGLITPMRVMIPARNFDREGVPLQGIEWGDRIGAMVWQPSVVFETTREPQDTETYTPSQANISTTDPDMRFFWPTGTQLAGDSVPSGGYTTVIDPKGTGNPGNSTGQIPPLPGDSGGPSQSNTPWGHD